MFPRPTRRYRPQESPGQRTSSPAGTVFTDPDPVSIPVPDGHERRSFGDLTVDIDRTLCVGFGDCIELGPALFEFDDEGIVRFREGCEATARETLIAACGICPVDALVVFDGDVRIVP